jgi:starch phosphorylase
MTAEEVERLRSDGYDPRRYIDASPRLADALDAVELGVFSPEEPGRFRPLVDAIRFKDTFMVCADFDEYVRMQAEVERVYRDRTAWNRRVVHNLARAGRFSSDRSIAEYARDIWDVEPVDVRVPQGRKE